MYAMAKPSQGLQGHGDLRRGQALQCSFYSSLAIGALMLGYPSEQVSRYMESARLCREQCRCLVDRLAVSALVLYSVARAFLGQVAACRQGMEEARALSSRSPGVDPVMSSYLRLQRFTEGLRALTADMLDGDNPVDAVRGPGGEVLAMEVETPRGRHVSDLIEDGRSNDCSFSATMSAYPSLVVSDGELPFPPGRHQSMRVQLAVFSKIVRNIFLSLPPFSPSSWAYGFTQMSPKIACSRSWSAILPTWPPRVKAEGTNLPVPSQTR